MTEKDIEKMLGEDDGLDMSHIKKDDILAKARQELYFGSASEAEVKKEKKSFFSIFSSKRFIPIVATIACVFTLFVGMIGLYNENYQTIYIDVNPSVALTLNRFDRVIEVKYLNDDAKNLLANTDLVGADVEDAMQTVISTCDKAGFVKEDSEIYLSAISKDDKKSGELLNKLKQSAQSMNANDSSSEGNAESKAYKVNVYNTKKEEKEKFEKSDISPAKDKMIREISEQDGDYRPEDLKGKSMYELSHIKKDLYKHDDEFDDDDLDKRPDKDDEDDRYDKDEDRDDLDDGRDEDDFDDRDENKPDGDDRDENKPNGDDRDDEHNHENKKPADKAESEKLENDKHKGDTSDVGDDSEEDDEDEDEDEDDGENSRNPQNDKKPMKK